jgi:hypothetical protein
MNIQIDTHCTSDLHSYADATFDMDDIRAPGSNGFIADESLPPLRCGFGKCSSSGCNCQAYEGNASTCGNNGCGHSFSDHW